MQKAERQHVKLYFQHMQSVCVQGARACEIKMTELESSIFRQLGGAIPTLMDGCAAGQIKPQLEQHTRLAVDMAMCEQRAKQYGKQLEHSEQQFRNLPC